MHIFILRDGSETGPLTWVDVFIMLRKGEVSTDVPARIGDSEEIKSLEEWGLWREGDEVGPFTWDEISAMLEAGVLDLEAQARFEGDPELGNLKGVVSQSQEIFLAGNKKQHAALWNLGELGGKAVRYIQEALKVPRTRLQVAGSLAVVLICIVAVASWGRSNQPQIKPAVEQQPTIAEQKSTVQESTPRQTPETIPVQEAVATPTAMAVAAPEDQQAVPSEPTTVKQDSEFSIPVEKPAQEIPAPSKTEVASTPTPQPDTPTPSISPVPQADIQTAKAAPPAPQPAASPAQLKAPPLAQASSPSPKLVATPAPVITSVTDFFKIQSVRLLKKEPKDGVGVWKLAEVGNKDAVDKFMPCLELKVTTAENIRSNKLTTKVYFYDRDNKLVATVSRPSRAGKRFQGSHFDMPELFFKDKPDRIFFEVPEAITRIEWKAVIVFGDTHEAKFACYPSDVNEHLLEYAEKQLVHDRSAKRVARNPAIDPLIEHVVKTRNPKVPQITLFLRSPKGVDKGEEIKGVLTLSLLASSANDIRKDFQKEEMEGDFHGLFAFANKHKLAVLAWGANTGIWAGANYDDLSSSQLREFNSSFNLVANAWERGVLELGEKYGIPTKNFMMWGLCGSAHMAHALCLAKPNYFLAIHIHIPGYFEKPTPEASKVLWCITTGELYGSYDYSLRFLADCKKLGYPIVYKAIIGLGHSGHPDATAMGLTFFEFALTQKDLREEYDRKMSSAIDKAQMAKSDVPIPWPDSFQNPMYYGDIINQESYPAAQKEMIPEKFRIPIPTKEIRAIWARQN